MKLENASAKELPKRKERLRELKKGDEPVKYGIPIEKYTTVLISDRGYQTHIMLSETRLLTERLKVLSEKFQVRGR